MNKGNVLLSGYASALITGLLLGLFPSVTKPILVNVNPVFFSAIVAFSSFVLLAPLSRSSVNKLTVENAPTKQMSVSKRRIYLVVIASSTVGGIIGPLAYFFGLQSTPASDASLLSNGEMVFTIIIASFAFREKLSPVGLLAVTLVSAGIVVVVSDLQFSSSVLNLTETGHLLIVFSGLCWGLDNNIITYASARIEASRFIRIRSAITGPVLLMVAFLLSAFPKFGSAQATILNIAWIFLVGFLFYGLALYFNFVALKWLGAIRSTLIFPISSIFGLIAASIVLGEKIGFYQIISVGVIFLGIYLLTRSGSVRKEYSYDLP